MTNEEIKNDLKKKVLNSEKLSEKDVDNLFSLFTEDELVSTFPQDVLNKILDQIYNTKRTKTPKDICTDLSNFILNALNYCGNISYTNLDDFNAQINYINLINGFQLFANNFISSVDNLNEGIEDKNIIKFTLPDLE